MIANNVTRQHPSLLLILILAVITGCSTTSKQDQAPAATEDEQQVSASQTEPEPVLAAEPQPDPAPAIADSSPLRSDVPDRYVVKKGDTLWDIAALFLKDPWKWPEVWYINPAIANPHLIYPGDVIALVYRDGKAVIVVNPGDLPPVRPGMPTVKLSPKARTESIRQAVTTIPKSAIAPFINQPLILDEDDLDNAAYIVSSPEEHLISGSGQRVYVNGLEHTTVGNFNIVRRGPAYIDPDTEEVLGYEAINLADASLITVGSPSTVYINKARQEVLVGDYLWPVENLGLALNFFPRAPTTKVDGKIISVYQGVRQIGQYHVVVLNRGTDNGLEAGHVLAVYQAGARVRDPLGGKRVTLPSERAGLVMVFRPYKRISYAIVMEAQRVLYVHDQVLSP